MRTANDLMLRALLHERTGQSLDPNRGVQHRLDALEQAVLLLLKIDVEKQEAREKRMAGPVVEFPAPATDTRGTLHSPSASPTSQGSSWPLHVNRHRFHNRSGEWVAYDDVAPFLQVLADLVKERHHPYSRQALAVMERAKALLNPPE